MNQPPSPGSSAADLSRAERNIRWIEANLRVPEGAHVGRQVILREWQRDLLRKIYDNPQGTRRAIVTFGRKNGKTALAAMLLLLHLVGPEARPNSQLYSAAQSRDQAALLFNLAAKMVRFSPTISKFVIPRDTLKELACPQLGTLYRALSAEATTAWGLSPVFVVHDELGQVKGPTSALYEATETATGAQEDPLSIVISTQAPTEADLLSVLIDDALEGHDPHTVVVVYAADMGLDPFSEEAIRQANPAFGDFQNAQETLAMANDAKRMPSRENAYRNLVLNQRVEAFNPIVSRVVWAENGDPVVDSFEGLQVYGGLDLSEVADLTAFVMIAQVNGVWHVKPTFWLPGEGLVERSRQDRVPYDQFARQGYLETTLGRSVEYEHVSEHLFEVCTRYDVRKIAFDRWNMKHLKPWLARAGFTEEQLEGDFAIFQDFGQGFASMSPALRDLESALLTRRVAHGNHPLLKIHAANAVAQKDPSGNRKPTKAKSRGRIDGMVALIMAVSVGTTDLQEQPPASPWEDPGYSIRMI